MKRLKEKYSFLVRLGITAGVLLLTQHALAAGTTAGTDVDNLATVNYAVGGAAQTLIESSPIGNDVPGATNGTVTSFEVDNRVDFTVAQVGTAHTTVSPGDTDAFVEFTLSNDGNSPMDFRMVALQLASGDGAVNSLVDTDVDMVNVRVRVGNGGGVPVLGDFDFVDEILEDETVTIYVFADAGLGLSNADIANLELSATAAAVDGIGGTLGADLVDDAGVADDPAVVDIVFADGVVTPPGLGDGVESDRDGFEVDSAELEITKVATVLDDPFNGTTFPKAIPGATVQYVITVDNTGTLDADNVVITDAIDTDVNMIFDFYGGHDVEIVNNLVTVTPCDVENLADSDGCGLAGQNLTIGDPTDLPLTVLAGTIMTITYRVTIP